jgi:predicted transcriptional regulator
MSLSLDELEILETMLLNSNSIEATQIAMENNKKLHDTIAHLTDLTSRGYVISSQKEHYTLTDEGKKVFGIQPITKEKAKSIIAYAPHDKAFNFHADNDSPHHHHMHAHSLQDFSNKISRVDLKAIESHMDNGDFEAWLKCLGDQKLTKKLAIIKRKKIIGEQLRLLLQNIMEHRCQELIKLAEYTTP